jgi:hypothetical protein
MLTASISIPTQQICTCGLGGRRMPARGLHNAAGHNRPAWRVCSTNGLCRLSPASQTPEPLSPSVPCMVAYLQPQALCPLISLDATSQPQALQKPRGLPDIPPHLTSDVAPVGPKPFGPLIETGAPCSEAVLLRGVIKRQEDVGTQALEWGRPKS